MAQLENTKTIVTLKTGPCFESACKQNLKAATAQKCPRPQVLEVKTIEIQIQVQARFISRKIQNGTRLVCKTIQNVNRGTDVGFSSSGSQKN